MKLVKFINSENNDPFLINPNYIKEVVNYKKLPDGKLDHSVCTIILEDKSEYSVQISFIELEKRLNEALKEEIYII